jgi:NAD(P)-dependent dehydrogenase (short-subunit alcohol dehydrogenase family)
MPRLAGKRCLIVGGTSGIGLAAARRFHQEGAALVVAGLAPPPEPLPFVSCDATDPVQVEGLFARAAEMLGGLDVLYHTAGGSGRRHGDGPLHDCADAGWQTTIALNLTGTFLTNRAAVRHFLGRRQPGVILNTASVLPLSPSPHFFDTCAYTAAKGGVLALSRLAAARYAADGIRVNVLAPGLIDTPMSQRAVADPAVAAFLRRKQPLAGGPGRPEDCADAAVFLCCDEARLVTGVVLPIDAGWSVSEVPPGEGGPREIG